HGHQHAGPVAGLAVGVDRAAVPDALQGADGELDHLAPRLAVDGADQADAAGVALRGGVVGVGGRERRAVGEVAGDLSGGAGIFKLAHDRHSAAMRADWVMCWWIASAASKPSRMAQTTSEAPLLMSPAAKTPGIEVIMVLKSVLTVPQRLTASSGAPNRVGRSSGS